MNAAVKRPRWLALIALLAFVAALGGWRYRHWRDHRFDAVILVAAQRYGVQPALVKAVVWRESRFNPAVRGRKNEFGLMQIRAETAADWARAERLATFVPEQLFDPATNTLVGAWYLAKLLKRYPKADDPLPYALADYNAGRSNVLRWDKGTGATNSLAFVAQIDFSGTRRYVRGVIRRYEHYRPIFPPKTS